MPRIRPVPTDASTLPPPNQWATFIQGRHPQFKSHSNLSLAKSAITNYTRRDGVSREVALCDCWVYEWVADEDGSRWVQRFAVPKGDDKHSHPLWKVTAKTVAPVAVSQKAVDKAMASIMKAGKDY